ncbi:MAG: helix-turn-helix domain-containing protein, partial [Clostridia bacterium]|nr:helix-turn-helix domain-containing protein [Clostridia bacterium]
ILRLIWFYNIIMKFQERLKELRTEKKLSQMQLATNLGISQSAIAKWELGKTEPTASAIITIAKYFEETTDYILGVTD